MPRGETRLVALLFEPVLHETMVPAVCVTLRMSTKYSHPWISLHGHVVGEGLTKELVL